MTTNKATGTQIFISDQKPATFDDDGFKALEWTEIGQALTHSLNDYVTYTPLRNAQTIRRHGIYFNLVRSVRKIATKNGKYTLEYLHRRMNKKKRARFGRIISFRRSIPFFV